MNKFKEWLSDYLRYLILLVALLLAVGAIVLGVKLYQSTKKVEGDPDSVQIVENTESESGETETLKEETEKETEETKKETEKPSEKETESETVTEKITEKVTEKKSAASEKASEEGETEKEASSAGTANSGETGAEDQNRVGTSQGAVTVLQNQGGETAPEQSSSQVVPITPPKETEAADIIIEETDPPQTDPPETDPPEPIYATLNHACYIRSYADYGDNILAEYPQGTVVEILEYDGGWTKVQVDGIVGYLGTKFVS